MARRQPEGPPPPPAVMRIRLRYAKRGRLRFSSHRDFARAFERSLRRAEVPMAYSAGFSPHPKISYLGAVPTGVGSEAEYLEISVWRRVDPEAVRAALDEVLPDGLDILEAVEAGPGSLAERIQASHWRLELRNCDPAELGAAIDTLMALEQVLVERLTKDGRRTLDARGPIVSATVTSGSAAGGDVCAILDLVVHQVTPAVRPDDVLAALAAVAGFAPQLPPRATRVAYGPLDGAGQVGDPLGADKALVEQTNAGSAP
jgi:radical SAM-linked protein